MSEDVPQHDRGASDFLAPKGGHASQLSEPQQQFIERLVWGTIGAVSLIAAVFVAMRWGFAVLLLLGFLVFVGTEARVVSAASNLFGDRRHVREIRKPRIDQQLSQVAPRLRREASGHAYEQYLDSLRSHGWQPGSGEPASYLYMRRRGK